jgi:hypothetical protein
MLMGVLVATWLGDADGESTNARLSEGPALTSADATLSGGEVAKPRRREWR